MKFSEPLGQEFEATSFSLSTTNPGKGGRPTRPGPQAMAFTKKTDALSSAMERHMATGTIFRNVAIEVRRDSHCNHCVTYDFGEVSITSLSSTGTTDSLDLLYKRVSVAYAH
ncbi:MAG: type VI secretion system tube protein Hcp [Bryobacteraceae bacterium]